MIVEMFSIRQRELAETENIARAGCMSELTAFYGADICLYHFDGREGERKQESKEGRQGVV